METEASTVREVTLVNIPGLLQTEAYMRASFASGPLPAFQVENEVKARLLRQRRLADEEFPLELTAIVDESALHKKVGSREVMRAQLRHLVEMAALPTVTLQLLPNDSGAPPESERRLCPPQLPGGRSQPALRRVRDRLAAHREIGRGRTG